MESITEKPSVTAFPKNAKFNISSTRILFFFLFIAFAKSILFEYFLSVQAVTNKGGQKMYEYLLNLLLGAANIRFCFSTISKSLAFSFSARMRRSRPESLSNFKY